MPYKLAFIGFGVVGQGLTEILIEKKEYLQKRFGFEWQIVAIADTVKGSIYNLDGLPASELVAAGQAGKLETVKAPKTGWSPLEVISKSNADIIVEVTFTNLKDGEPATTHCKTAFNSGKHLVTTNKGPLALYGAELIKLAKDKGVQFRYEGTVMAGTPAINLALEGMAGCTITRIEGIINGTTNYILSQMEEGMDYSSALKKAQELGYAEADPTGDVEGFDAMGKVLILANTVMGAPLKAEEVEREGITGITSADIASAKGEGKRWKLIGSVWNEGGKVGGRVRPQKVELTHPLASVMGATNALTFTTDNLHQVTIIGPGAGRKETGQALLSDILAIHRALGK
jgi:homoserine dehydrogenase